MAYAAAARIPVALLILALLAACASMEGAEERPSAAALLEASDPRAMKETLAARAPTTLETQIDTEAPVTEPVQPPAQEIVELTPGTGRFFDNKRAAPPGPPPRCRRAAPGPA